MSSAGPRLIAEMMVTSLVVSARGSAHAQIRDPSSCTPEGPKAASFSGTPSSWASTPSLRIARQSVGSATPLVGVGLGVGLGDVVVLAVGDSLLLGLEDSLGVPASGDSGVQPARTMVSTRAAKPATSRAFMATPYRLASAADRAHRGSVGG